MIIRLCFEKKPTSRAGVHVVIIIIWTRERFDREREGAKTVRDLVPAAADGTNIN